MSKLQIIDLHVSVEGKEILKGVNLEMNTGEFHVIMGPNGTGKSTLVSTIMGHYKYEVTQGQILLDGEDVLKMTVDERSRKGLFLAMQYPSEIEGVTNSLQELSDTMALSTNVSANLPSEMKLSLKNKGKRI